MGFVKCYDDDLPDGYISTDLIRRFDIEWVQESDYSDEHYIVRAMQEGADRISDGFQVSPKIATLEKANDFLDSLVEKLR